jgi:predicted nucleic acid-binding protein
VSRFVLDNTITMAWCFTEEATDFTETLLSRFSNMTDSAIVPALWLDEVVNVTELAVRKGRIAKEKASAFLESLADLPIEIENPAREQIFVFVRVLVGQYKLTAYDASYLELAIRHKVSIATLDGALTNAAQAPRVNLVQL